MAHAAAPGTDRVPGAALLLDGETRSIAMRTHSLDVQARFGRPGAARAVVMVTRVDDPDADELSLRLASRGVPLLRLDADREIETELRWDGSRVTLTLEGRDYEPALVWRRLFATAKRPDFGLSARAAQHAGEQWLAWSSNLADLHGSVVVNPGAVLVDAPNRLAQLALAHAVGLVTPRSVATCRPAGAARQLAPADAFVVKALGHHHIESPPGIGIPLSPRVMDADELTHTVPQSAPVLVQEHVPHDHELRVFVVGDRVIAFAVSKPAIGAHLDAPETITVTPAEIDPMTAARLRALVADCRLQVAAVDLLMTRTGPVFLEVNASANWRWFERKAGRDDVSQAVCTWVVEQLGGSA